MNAKNILSWLLLLFGEAIIIAAFILLRGSLEDDILVLNIAVSSIVYCSIFLSFKTPWVDLQDRSQKRVGGLGIKWFTVWMYVIFAIATMIVANIYYPLSFKIQLLIHAGLFFFLFLGFLFSKQASDKVEEVYRHEQSEEIKKYRERIESLKNE